ncbi:MAG: alpha/beta hydrolase [candidate division Zixibacteria bacterium]|nr:alpha/beta hydrolase [candidate division Zixibacteria bacterium]
MVKDILKLVLIGITLFAAGFILKSAGIIENSANASDDIHLTFETKDKLILHGWKTEAVADSAGLTKPGLALLLPMMSKTHLSYEPFREQLNEIGYTTIVFDMRGHGLSVSRGEQTLSYSEMLPEEFVKMPADIESFFLDFKTNNPDTYNYNDVIVIGSSIGANTAGILLEKSWLSRSVLLSPGKDYRSLIPGTVMISETNPPTKPVYIAAAVDDTYSAQSSQWLFENYSGLKVFKKYPGKDHGTNILLNVDKADVELLEWLKKK